MPNIFAVTGVMFSGKDYVIKQTGCPHFSLSVPIHDVVEQLYGDSISTKPGRRAALQRIGRWGRGEFYRNELIDEEHVIDLSTIREKGNLAGGPKWQWVDWNRFGQKTFWLDIVSELVTNLHSKHDDTQPSTPCFVSSIRYPEELCFFLNKGAKHVHIYCTEETQYSRMKAAGYRPTNDEFYAPTESFVNALNSDTKPWEYAPWRIPVWNDDAPQSAKWKELPKTIGKCCWTVSEFLDMVKAAT